MLGNCYEPVNIMLECCKRRAMPFFSESESVEVLGSPLRPLFCIIGWNIHSARSIIDCRSWHIPPCCGSEKRSRSLRMNLILFALRRPITVVIALVAIGLGCVLAIWQMPVDIFPSLNLPVIYVCQPYGGMDPAQMEGFLANYYEYHFLYITGIHHVESQNIQGLSLMKLYFHPGTNMAQAMAETVSYVNRARAFMPPDTVSPFVMRFDTGSVPVGYLVLSSETRSIGEIQDLALFRVRPMFASLPGVSAPPPFGGNQRTVVVTVDPQRLRAYDMTPDDVVSALAQGNAISPSGNLPLDGKYPFVPVNSVVRDVHDLETIPLRSGPKAPVYIQRRGIRPGQHGCSYGLRVGQRPPGRLHPGHQACRRLDHERGQRGEGGPARHAGGPAAGHPRQLRVRPVALRDAGHLGRRGRRGAGGRAGRPDDPRCSCGTGGARSSSC